MCVIMCVYKAKFIPCYCCHGASMVAQMVKNLPTMRRPGFHPWVGKVPRGAWWAVVRGVTESDTAEWCTDNAHMRAWFPGFWGMCSWLMKYKCMGNCGAEGEESQGRGEEPWVGWRHLWDSFSFLGPFVSSSALRIWDQMIAQSLPAAAFSESSGRIALITKYQWGFGLQTQWVLLIPFMEKTQSRQFKEIWNRITTEAIQQLLNRFLDKPIIKCTMVCHNGWDTNQKVLS